MPENITVPLSASNIYSRELYFKVASKLLVETLLVIRNDLIELISVIDFSFSFNYNIDRTLRAL